jgi:segregation and condensation protein A
MYIKSKMLLPVYEDENQDDPRASLVEALMEYQRIKEAGSVLSLRAQIGRDLFVKGQEQLAKEKSAFNGSYSYEVLTRALEDILQRAQRKLPPPVTAFQGIVGRETVPVDDKIGEIVRLFVKQPKLSFEKLVLSAKSRSEIVAIFLAVLELSKTRKIMIEETKSGDCTLRLATKEEQALSVPQVEDDREDESVE